jgi:hypothetical protein
MLSQTEIDNLKTTWKELADQSYDIFGVNVEFFYKRIKTADDLVQTPFFNSVNSRGKETAGYFIEEEISETLKVKLYWNRKEWKKIIGDIVMPDDTVLMLCKLADYGKIKDSVTAKYKDFLLTRSSISLPYSFNSDKYNYMLWKVE